MRRFSALYLPAFTIIGFILMFNFAVIDASAQSYDHEKYPKLDFNFLDLELNLGLQPQNLRIDGNVKYRIEANISGADTLTLYASRLDISNVSVDGEAADFSLHNDSLFVPVDDSTEVGNRYEVRIRYSGQPQFGLLKNSPGTVWTSQLPQAQRHWVPIVDNPHVEMKTIFNISVPSGVQVWASGAKTNEEVLSVDAVRYRFESQNEIPASSLSFAVGNFDNSSTGFGTKKINLALEKSLTDSLDSQQLLERAYDYVGRVEDYLKREYPYGALQVVVLSDHHWEVKSWAGSTVFIYVNHGNIETQLLRGIIGQWFGVYQREQQWKDADAITLYQTLIMDTSDQDEHELTVKDQPGDETKSVYDNFGVKRWNSWQKGIEGWQSPSVRSYMLQSAREMLEQYSVIGWQQYADYWYSKIGQPVFETPVFSMDSSNRGSKPASDSIAYEVYYDWNEAEGELKLRFEAVQGVFEELVTLQAHAVYAGKTDISEVTFTGRQDSVLLQVDPMIKTLRLTYENHSNLFLDEYKPSAFLIHELRNTESVEQRALAAQKLGYHKDNPDLQLAIQDFMKQGLEPQVEAGLLLSLADITDGASGTEEMFLDALKSKHRVIREAGLMALQNYPENSIVINTVQAVAQSVDDFELFKKAVQVLTTIMSEEAFDGFAESIVQSDDAGKRSIFVIQELANMGRIEKAIEQAELFTDTQYRYDIRSRAYKILIQHDRTAADWMDRAEDLYNETDPRIRFLMIRGLERNMNNEIHSFLSDYRQDEYDERVHRKIEELIE